MSAKEIGIVELDIGYLNVFDSFHNSVVYKNNGDQNFNKTLENYIELLKKATLVLETVRDTTQLSESESLTMFVPDEHSGLYIKGHNEIVERYVGFGIAHCDESNSDNGESSSDDSESDSDDFEEYGELCASDSDENDSNQSDSDETKISNDSDQNSDESDNDQNYENETDSDSINEIVEEKPKKAPRKKL